MRIFIELIERRLNMESTKRRSSAAEDLTFSDTVSKLGGDLREVGSQLSEVATKTVGEVTKIGEDKFVELRKQGEEYLSQLEVLIKQKPVRSIVIGALAGFVLGKVFTRS